MTSLIQTLQKGYKYFLIALKGEETEFTTGSINKAIFLLSVPMVLEMIMESLFAVVDVFFVGKVSVDAVATVGLTESVVMIVYSVAIGLSMAATAVVARRIGEKNPKKAGDAAFQSILIAVSISIVVSIFGIIYAEDILRMMGGTEQLIAQGAGYTRVMLGGNASIMLLFLINGIYRGAGDASMAMRSLWIANGLNIVLDPIFIFGLGPIPGFGVEGAAIATTIGRSTGVFYQLVGLFGGQRIIKLTIENVKVQWQTIRRIFDIAAGGMGQFLIESASWIFLVRIISEFGSAALAGYTIAFRIIVFTILPSWGMANAAATLVGQNLGAGKPERAESSVWKTAHLNTAFLFVVSIVFFWFAQEFVGIFSNEPVVKEHGALALRVICVGYITFAYGMVISQGFNGAGDTKTPVVMNIIFFWLIQIPLAYTLAIYLNYGFLGAMISVAVAFALHALACIYWFRKGKWKLVKV
ncbi:MATE family efflux transporter [Reichenbachiella carrageenanivorans]|uniref:Multidrug-efflux transporter n=1 Tax=Reichenbachiella carrageenanivorans TaxID=2979869 RepID=A0ABY6D307_9BACT|nr:MATE family efflux transporter [Reichenbachiella carrageenanivorans]UXX80551.1 MATE family efflux transporter [Reichenbachiella carrageenanivorans]